ncbi:MAG TPA: DUF3096 domain-containing protein [Acidimicrobiia bacterium]|nr:DUF3096 domain-containing protein [Acidimicrobiia bacterium]
MLALIGGATEVAVNLTVPGIVALVAGILILIIPRLLNYIVAAYLIIIGFIQVFDVTL